LELVELEQQQELQMTPMAQMAALVEFHSLDRWCLLGLEHLLLAAQLLVAAVDQHRQSVVCFPVVVAGLRPQPQLLEVEHFLILALVEEVPVVELMQQALQRTMVDLVEYLTAQILLRLQHWEELFQAALVALEHLPQQIVHFQDLAAVAVLLA
jgi:hypothetical protein